MTKREEIDRLKARIAFLELLVTKPAQWATNTTGTSYPDCGCPKSNTCMNVACPRVARAYNT